MNTAIGHNQGLTGRIETVPDSAYVPIEPACSQSEQKNATNKTPEWATSEYGRGATKRNMRLALAREAYRDLENTQEADRRLELMILIERLTSGRKIRKKGQSKAAFE